MQKKYEEKYHELEDTHWWFVGRREIISSLVEEFPKNIKILEVGCSGGNLIKALKKNGYKNVLGIDISKKAIDLCKKKGIRNVYVMSGENLKFRKKFDLIIMSDVLEHIKDEKKTLLSLRKSLKRRGKVICFVPAFMFLWSYHDELNKHYRRYTRKELVNLFKENKFNILKASYWNFILFLPILAGKKLFNKEKINEDKNSHLYSHGRFINFVLLNILRIENSLLKIFDFSFGISAFLIAEKSK